MDDGNESRLPLSSDGLRGISGGHSSECSLEYSRRRADGEGDLSVGTLMSGQKFPQHPSVGV